MPDGKCSASLSFPLTTIEDKRKFVVALYKIKHLIADFLHPNARITTHRSSAEIVPAPSRSNRSNESWISLSWSSRSSFFRRKNLPRDVASVCAHAGVMRAQRARAFGAALPSSCATLADTWHGTGRPMPAGHVADRPQQRRGTSRVGIPMKVADRSLPHRPRRARGTRTV